MIKDKDDKDDKGTKIMKDNNKKGRKIIIWIYTRCQVFAEHFMSYQRYEFHICMPGLRWVGSAVIRSKRATPLIFLVLVGLDPKTSWVLGNLLLVAEPVIPAVTGEWSPLGTPGDLRLTADSWVACCGLKRKPWHRKNLERGHLQRDSRQRIRHTPERLTTMSRHSVVDSVTTGNFASVVTFALRRWR